VKKLIALAFAFVPLAACASRPPAPAPASSPAPAPVDAVTPSGGITGAADARSAVLAFVTAGKNQDLDALSAVWGSTEGSVRTTNTIPRDEMEKRELIMMCYLEHETHQIVSDAPAANNERVVAVQLRRGSLTRTANFYAVAGPGGRWYVRAFEMEALTDFCRKRGR
jgi:hypothetical protein